MKHINEHQLINKLKLLASQGKDLSGIDTDDVVEVIERMQEQWEREIVEIENEMDKLKEGLKCEY